MVCSYKTRGYEPPERLDTFFGMIAGLYIAFLISPPILLLGGKWLTASGALFSLTVLILIFTAVVSWGATRLGKLIMWLNSTWLALLVAGVGLVPLVAYHEVFYRYVAVSVTDLQATSATSLIGFIGSILGMLASCLGVVLVHMARTRLTKATLNGTDVDIKWTAGRPRKRIFKIRLGAALITVALFGIVWLSQQDPPTLGVIYIGVLVGIALAHLDTDHTYRLTPIGLNRRTNNWVLITRTHFPWETFTGFSVTEDAIVLHRPSPRPDVRWSRADIIQTEPAIVESLTDHLDRRT